MGYEKPGSGQKRAHEDTHTAALIWLGLSVTIALLLFVFYYWKKKEKKKSKTGARLPNALNADTTAVPAATLGGARRRPRTARQRMMRQRADDDVMEDSDQEGSDNELSQVPWKDEEGSGKIGAKKMKRLQEKAEKKEQRELLLQQREEKKKEDELREQERKREEELLRLEEEKLEEEERRKKEEQERKEHEEYLLLKAAFTVEEEGESGILSEEESQMLLQEFIDFLKNKKVVMLEELASQFNLRVQEVIQRLEDLQESGRITGVMDDRGKFIYISEVELENFARYVRQRGRVAISDLADASNTLISLQGSITEDQIKSQPVEVS